jgi:hypothetical protein
MRSEQTENTLVKFASPDNSRLPQSARMSTSRSPKQKSRARAGSIQAAIENIEYDFPNPSHSDARLTRFKIGPIQRIILQGLLDLERKNLISFVSPLSL